MNNKKIDSHPSIVHCDELNAICQPLEKLHGIDYFVHVNVDKAGNFSALGKKPAFVEHYLKSKYYNHDIHLSQSEMQMEYVIHDGILQHGATQQLAEDCKHFQLYHIFSILHKSVDSLDGYHFATSKQDNNINEVYLRSLPLLKQFISYFKQKVQLSKNLSSAYNFQFSIDDKRAAYESDLAHLTNNNSIKEFIQSIAVERYQVFNNEKSYITKRELECLVWLHFGKTAEDIATLLNITERTVRAHINSVRAKLKCKTLFQLGEKINQYDLLANFISGMTSY